MRELAINDYGCAEFYAVTEGTREVANSYWDNEARMRQWKQNAEHLVAQQNGRSRWYHSYSVDMVQVVRTYSPET